MNREAQPPRAARWLLLHFGCSPNNDAVIGDLDERYRGARTAGWYWREVFTAILSSFWSEIQSHKLLAIRAVVTGWLASITCIALLFSTFAGISGFLTVTLSSPAMWPPTTGLGDLNRAFHIEERFFQFQIPWSVRFAIFITISLLAYASAGALIAKLHRPYERAMALAFVASQLIPLALNFSFISIAVGMLGTVWGA